MLALDEVVDALVIDMPREGTDGWMPLFVVLREGESLDDSLIAEIRRRVREDCSPRHVPDEIRQIAEVPRTLSGKVLEVPVKRILMGTPADQAASRESLANPAALDYFVNLCRVLGGAIPGPTPGFCDEDGPHMATFIITRSTGGARTRLSGRSRGWLGVSGAMSPASNCSKSRARPGAIAYRVADRAPDPRSTPASTPSDTRP